MTNLHGKPLDPNKLRLADHAYKRWHLDLRTLRTTDNERVTLKDLLTRPEVWAKQTGIISAGDLVRVTDDDLDVEIKVVAIGAGGIMCECHPSPTPGSAKHKQLLAVQAAVRAEENAAQMDLTSKMLGVAS